MSSDPKEATFERFVKLLQSVMQLAVGNKRSLNTMCATMQSIVFEESGYIPAHKNWKAIAKLSDTNQFLMMGIATLPATKEGMVDVNDYSVQQIIAAFPECFGEEVASGPIPLSVLKHAKDEIELTSEQPTSGAAHELGLPVVEFSVSEEYVRQYHDQGIRALPSSIPANSEFASIVSWQNKSFVVIYVDGNELHVAPAECIDLNR